MPRSSRNPRLPYQRASYPTLGGWNPQERDTAEDANTFYVVKNMRQEHPGEWTTRSGYKNAEYECNTDTIVYSKGEYIAFGRAFDVTMLYTGGTVRVVFIDKSSHTIHADVAILSDLTEAPEHVCGAQFHFYWVISIYKHKMIAVFPENEATMLPMLTVELGKDIADTVKFRDLNFAQEITGDLIVYQAKDNAGNAEYIMAPNQGEPVKIRLPISAKYFLVSGPKKSEFDPSNFKYFKWNNADPMATVGATSSFAHIRTNGWGYRAVYLYQMTDSRGNKFSFRSAPSADWWVPDMMYVPAYGAFLNNAGDRTIGQPMDWQDLISFGGRLWSNFEEMITPYIFTAANIGQLIGAVPSKKDMQELQMAYRKFFNSDKSAGARGGTADPFVYVSRWLGFGTETGDPKNDAHAYNFYPYKIPVYASELKGAPMTEMSWNDFKMRPATVIGTGSEVDPTFIDFDTAAPNIKIVGVEIYRTPYISGDTKSVDELNSYRYGYVTTLRKGRAFVDDVTDEQLIFDRTPDGADGYLKGQLTGKVLRVYNQSLTLGNIHTEYFVRKPSIYQQAVAKPGTGIPSWWFDETVLEEDGYPPHAFFYQYVDTFGNVSDSQYIHVDFTAVRTDLEFDSVCFLIPPGYSASIVSVRIIHSQWIGGERIYRLENDVSVKSSVAVAFKRPKSTEVDPQKNVYETIEEGALAYGEVNSLVDFPFDNFEIISKESPITYMDTIVGPLWVWTTRGVDLTVFTRGEEESRYVGCVGFNAACKVNKNVFFLSANGLYYSDASGVMPFPGNISDIIRAYIEEKIDGLPDLSSIRRASLGYNGKRDELWIHLPSSKDIGGNLPNRMLIFRFFGSIANWINYEFDLTNALDQSAYPEILRPVVLSGQTDGIWSAHYQSQNSKIYFMNNDSVEYDDRWMGYQTLEKRLPMGTGAVRKVLRAAEWRMACRAKASICTGIIARQTLTIEPLPDYRGEIYQAARIFDVNVLGAGEAQTFRHIISGHASETTGYVPAVRFTFEPNIDGDNDVTMYALDVELSYEGNHP